MFFFFRISINIFLCHTTITRLFFPLYFTDIDECRQDPNVCPPPGNCFNTLGSYRCLCPKPYKLDSTGARCVDPKQSKIHQNECFGPDCENLFNNNNNYNNNNYNNNYNNNNNNSNKYGCQVPSYIICTAIFYIG